ncbi:sugar phosphate nucleotidyltransferase [Nisaea acidiphila]|uniref:Sugar phosphate nucleotidyltransferase n=1 Tax=Nisaea acidiphila TaxID=1862145 RepID=A0A9J7AMF6_9PROT|nr:sugar phosphate nucleotidyltransferase [Nisaea acidiphila]UUX48351.1 sugar phosphate nucleotidyltransferase [Nisaea acidiphila]
MTVPVGGSISITWTSLTRKVRREAFRCSLNLPPSEPFLVINGDILTSLNFQHLIEFHQVKESCATMAVYEHKIQVPYGVVEADGDRMVRIMEKPHHSFFVNAGIYVLNPEILELIPKQGVMDMPSLFEELLRSGRHSAVFTIRDHWLDIGHPQDLERAEDRFEEMFRS